MTEMGKVRCLLCNKRAVAQDEMYVHGRGNAFNRVDGADG